MSKAWLSVIATAVLATGLASAYMYNATRNAVDRPIPTPIVITPTDAGASGSLVISPTMASVSATPKAAPPAVTTPVVVFEAEGSISASDKTEIQKRILDPMIDYYAAETGSGKLLTITVSSGTQANKDTYPYLAKAIFDTGVNLGLAIEKDGTSFKWWKPECMGACPFTPEYKAKYPEVTE